MSEDDKDYTEALILAEKLSDSVEEIDDDEPLRVKTSKKQIRSLQKIKDISEKIRSSYFISSATMTKGDQWGHLEIIEKIGEGGIGEVYLAHDSILDCNVAVKFLSQSSQLIIDKKQFLNEARNMAAVQHPHILAIHGAMIEKGIAGYWSDFLDGKLLSETLTHDSIDWQQQLSFALQLCGAVKYIHKNNLVHGDIKAVNVMLQPNRGAILLDFGSSKNHLTVEKKQFIQASPIAMSPEQFDGSSASTASDVFTLGLLFWYLSTAKHPLHGLEFDDLCSQASQLHAMKKELIGNNKWKRLILSMLAKEPKDRPDIYQVEKKLEEIKRSPLRQAKKIAVISTLMFAAGITSISTYSSYKAKQSNKEIHALNEILSGIILKSSPIMEGKEVLLVDLLDDTERLLKEDQEISQQQKIKSLTQVVKTYRHQSHYEKSLQLADYILKLKNLTISNKLNMLLEKSAAFNDMGEFHQAEPLLLEILELEVNEIEDHDRQLNTMTVLIRTYNESAQLDKVPELITTAKSKWQETSRSSEQLAKIYLVEGNYHEIKEQFTIAYELYEKAVKNFEDHYGSKNIDVLIAKGAAATVLTYQPNTREQGVAMLETVVAEMTEFLGAEHSSTLIARANLASGYAELGEFDQAIQSLKPSIPDVYKAFGPTSGTTLLFEQMLSEFYAANNQTIEARQLLQKIVDVQQEKHGKHSRQTMEARLGLASLTLNAAQLEKAEQEFKALHADMHGILLKEHSLKLKIEEHLIWAEHLMGDDSATKRMEALIDKMTNILGPDDPVTHNAANHLKQMLIKQ